MSESNPTPIEILGATLTPNQNLILKKLRKWGGTVTVRRMANATHVRVAVVHKEVDRLSRLERLKVYFAWPEGKTQFRLRTWEDVDNDHIRDMARRGGVW